MKDTGSFVFVDDDNWNIGLLPIDVLSISNPPIEADTNLAKPREVISANVVPPAGTAIELAVTVPKTVTPACIVPEFKLKFEKLY